MRLSKEKAVFAEDNYKKDASSKTMGSNKKNARKKIIVIMKRNNKAPVSSSRKELTADEAQVARRYYNLKLKLARKNPDLNLPIHRNPAFRSDDSLGKRIGFSRSRSDNSFAKKIIIKVVKKNSIDSQSQRLMRRDSTSHFSTDEFVTRSSASTVVQKNSRNDKSRRLMHRNSTSSFSADDLATRSSGSTVTKRNSRKNQSQELMRRNSRRDFSEDYLANQNSGTTPRARGSVDKRRHHERQLAQYEEYQLSNLKADVQKLAASSLMSYDSYEESVNTEVTNKKSTKMAKSAKSSFTPKLEPLLTSLGEIADEIYDSFCTDMTGTEDWDTDSYGSATTKTSESSRRSMYSDDDGSQERSREVERRRRNAS